MGEQSLNVVPASVRDLGGSFADAGAGLGAITTHTALPAVAAGLHGTSVPGACHFGAGMGALALRILSTHLGELGEHSAQGAASYEVVDAVGAQDFCDLEGGLA
ncbi:hypothetical protein ACFXHA_36670 [Nocardia sp. NPDC059240]|uniref:hypothetical protein n=1 Tax=Nocardia sp. NPDC059240 TaxID=3346786 RepID=UPI00368A2453